MVLQSSRVREWLRDRFGLPEERVDLRKGALRELERRAFFGSFIYPACWLGISLSAGRATLEQPAFAWIMGALTTLMLARCVIHASFDHLLARADVWPRAVFVATVLSTALTYGIATLLTLRLPELREMQYPMLISCGVICTTATMILAIDPILRFGIPVVMLLPIAIGLALDETQEQMTLTILLIVNVGYLIVGSKDTHRDYWETVRVRESLRRQAAASELASRTDPLTGIPNRLFFDKVAQEAWVDFKTHGRGFSVVLLDVDHFKRVNDVHGHAVGDQCLVAVAAALQSVAQREEDLVARFGGEEFIALLIGSRGESAFELAERFLLAVSEVELVAEHGSLTLTCSAGVATVNTHSESIEEVIRRADTALYAAKRAGRGRVQEAG